MKKLISFKMMAWTAVLSLFLYSITACNDAGNNEAADEGSMETMDSMQTAMATITGTFPDTMVSGTAQFTKQADGKVKLLLHLSVPSRAGKSVAVHIHEGSDCGDTAQHAMGHWNPTNAQHGQWGSASFHSGDIGNINLDAQGNADFELETDLWSISTDAQKGIVNRTIIVHSGVDDYTSQPSGNSGTRIGCGVITAGS